RGIHGTETLALVQIGDANATTSGLVFVTRTDAARSGADRNAVLPALRHLLHDAMEWKNHVRPVANGQPLLHVNAFALQCLHFVEQRLGIDYDTVSDHGLD